MIAGGSVAADTVWGKVAADGRHGGRAEIPAVGQNGMTKGSSIGRSSANSMPEPAIVFLMLGIGVLAMAGSLGNATGERTLLVASQGWPREFFRHA